AGQTGQSSDTGAASQPIAAPPPSLVHLKRHPRRLTAFIQRTELDVPGLFETHQQAVLATGLAQGPAIEEPPALAAAAQCRDVQLQRLAAGGRTAQVVAGAYPDDR